MTKLLTICSVTLFAASAWAQQPEQRFLYQCTIVDGVSVTPDGALVRNADTQAYVTKQSPFTLDTSTGEFQRAAAPAGIVEIFDILSHGGAIGALNAQDSAIGVGQVLHIRVDMPGPPYRFVLQGSGSTFSGTCQRTPK